MRKLINKVKTSEAYGLGFSIALVAVPMLIAGLQWRWIPFFFGWPVPMPWPDDPAASL